MSESFISSIIAKKDEFISGQSFEQFKKYIITGLSAAALEYGLFNLLVYIAHMGEVSSHAISMFAGFILSFLLNKYWSFKSQEGFGRQFILTGILFLVNLGISSMLMREMVEKFYIPAPISKIALMFMIVLWNFILFKKVIYKK